MIVSPPLLFIWFLSRGRHVVELEALGLSSVSPGQPSGHVTVPNEPSHQFVLGSGGTCVSVHCRNHESAVSMFYVFSLMCLRALWFGLPTFTESKVVCFSDRPSPVWPWQFVTDQGSPCESGRRAVADVPPHCFHCYLSKLSVGWEVAPLIEDSLRAQIVIMEMLPSSLVSQGNEP